MDQLEIRHALEEKIIEIGGEIEGAGCLMVEPFTMDIGFKLDNKRYRIDLKELK